jgi:nucleotide-binding universal stress UspA family protein
MPGTSFRRNDEETQASPGRFENLGNRCGINRLGLPPGSAPSVGLSGSRIFLVHVIELPDNTPLNAEVPNLEAKARKILGAGERVARRSGLSAKTLVLRAHSASFALLDELKEKNCDLAVLGYHHGRTLGEVVFGTTAKHLATSSPCHMVLSIPPRK